VQLLDEALYPDEVLLTIARSPADPPFWATVPRDVPPRMSFLNEGPWCKRMNVNDGSTSSTVDCDEYRQLLRPFTEPAVDPKSTEVASCFDNCDGSSATCEIIRDGVVFTIGDIPFAASSTKCAPKAGGAVIPLPPPAFPSGLFHSFTLSDIATTYIGFATNLAAVEFDDSVYPPTVKVYAVEREGDPTDWQYLTPTEFGFDPWNTGPVAVYESKGHNVLSIPLPCCLCYGQRLSAFSITKNEAARTQIFTLSSLGFGGGSVDGLMGRAFNWGLFYSDTVKLYDLTAEALPDAVASPKTLDPDLCDVIASCPVSPCSLAVDGGCPFNPTAKCMDDVCGGCNARWLCGNTDITNQCDATPASEWQCPNTP